MRALKKYTKQIFGIILSLAILLLFLHLYIQPRFESPSRASFIQFMLTRAEKANQNIVLQRQKLLILYSEFKNRRPLSPLSKEWLLYLSTQYNVQHPNFSNDKTWRILLNRVDIVPNSLVIAQSIDESDWGQSHFAQDGNNYFGVWCYTPGCGIVPQQASDSYFHAVKQYASAANSVEDYMNNLNSHGGYQAFRDKREALREQGATVNGAALADTLTYYSQRRDAYVTSIESLIDRYNLEPYDDLPFYQGNLSARGFLNQLKTKKIIASAIADASHRSALSHKHQQRQIRHPATFYPSS